MIHIEAAKMPGFIAIMGQVAAAGATTLNIPDMAVNIGGHGQGFIINALSGWSPVDNQDGTIGSEMQLGDDIYLYATANPTGVADLVASKNITAPDGYDTLNSRRIGGFHFGLWRPTSERYNKAYVPQTIIVPTSVWDQNHRPTCDPSGMVEVIKGQLWADIYLSSEDGTPWPETVPLSRYGATPLSGANGFSRFLDTPILAANSGKRLPTVAEFFRYADGSPEGDDTNNDTAWCATSNSDHAATGTVVKAVSCVGVVDAVGNLWEPTSEHYDIGSLNDSDFVDVRTDLENGKDSSHMRGEANIVKWRLYLVGGGKVNGSSAGARTIAANNNPVNVISSVGLRCVAPARQV
ncbi:SUMF1/EgtB/PvdO family nonheme iron enzyme [Idiomarina sp.]|uniref:phage major tropism determinant n=1 Tax=Idiomarina sp. TaxID=1874361 RepID=UPI003A914199